MKYNIKISISTSVLALIIFLFPSTVLAQESPSFTQMIRVSPVILKVALIPGTIQNHQIKVENLLNAPIPIWASVEGFDASDEEYGISPLPADQTVSPLVGWTTLSDSDVILPSKSSRTFNVKITIPGKVPVGGYYAVIFFTPLIPGSPVNSKVGVLALANIGVGDQKNQADVVTFSFDHNIYEKGPVGTTIRVKNTSLNYFTAKPTLTIKPLFGQTETFELSEKTILPGKIRRWQESFDLGQMNGGIYTARLAVSLERGNYVYTQSYFFGFPIKKFGAVILLIIIALYSVIYRQRVKKALFLLLKGDKK